MLGVYVSLIDTAGKYFTLLGTLTVLITVSACCHTS